MACRRRGALGTARRMHLHSPFAILPSPSTQPAAAPPRCNAQVLPIWEGTTSVLSLDVLRVLSSTPQAAATFLRQCSARLAAARDAAEPAGRAGAGSAALAPLRQAIAAAQRSLPGVAAQLEAAAAAPSSPAVQVEARQLAFSMSRLFVAGERWPACRCLSWWDCCQGWLAGVPDPILASDATLPPAASLAGSAAGRACSLERGGRARPAGGGVVQGEPWGAGGVCRSFWRRAAGGCTGPGAHGAGAVWGGPPPAAAASTLLTCTVGGPLVSICAAAVSVCLSCLQQRIVHVRIISY